MSDPEAQVDGERIGAWEQPSRVRLVIAIATVLIVTAAAFWIARALTGPSAVPKSWVDGVAQLGADHFSIEYDGFTYGSDLHVMSWIDASGSWHDQGIPSCLRDEPGTSVHVRFQAREVTVDQLTWRPIVSIDCR